MGTTFDYEGQPRRRVALIDKGVANKPVTDSYWAAKLGVANTGHALPAPNPYGPMPMNLEMAAGDASLDELIGSVTRGVYVTRFHYVNVEDPISVLLTGMTRDGTFLIENGRLTRPLQEPALHPKRRRGARELRGRDARAQVRRAPRRARSTRPGCCSGGSRSPGRRRSRDPASRTQHEPRRSSHAGARCLESGRSPRRGVQRRRYRFPAQESFARPLH